MLEQLRYNLNPPALDKFFKNFCDSRELADDSLIVTHIYLLVGCALPPTMSFVLFSGGLFNSEYTTIACSGVIFLGVGDVAAALYGRKYGKNLWFEGSKKTSEGSMACMLSMSGVYLLLVKLTCPVGYNLYVCYFAASLAVTLVEAYTEQYDNLICTVVYFVAMIQMIDSFN